MYLNRGCRGQGNCPTLCGRGRRPGLRALGFRPPLLEEDVLPEAEGEVDGGAGEGEVEERVASP